MNAWEKVGNFFKNCWNAYFDFMTGVFGQDVAIVITVFLIFAIVVSLFFFLIRWFSD